MHSCGKIFRDIEKEFYIPHVKTCQSFNATTNTLGRRFIKNVVVFKNKHYCNSTNTFKRIYLKLEKSQLNAIQKPLLIGVADFECTNVKYKHDELTAQATDKNHRPPKSSKFIQTPLAYSLCFDSPYDFWRDKLPKRLKTVEMKIFEEESYTEEQFFMYFLTSLREKLVHIDNFLKFAKSLDPGVPRIQSCPISDRIERALATNCYTCGTRLENEDFFHSGIETDRQTDIAHNQSKKILN